MKSREATGPASDPVTDPVTGRPNSRREQRKPIFDLTVADGAIGAHANAVAMAKEDFKNLSLKIAGRIGLPVKEDQYYAMPSNMSV